MTLPGAHPWPRRSRARVKGRARNTARPTTQAVAIAGPLDAHASGDPPYAGLRLICVRGDQ